MEALLQRGGLESVGAGGSKATMGVLRAELEQVKQVLAKGQQEMTDRMEVLAGAHKKTKEEVLAEVQKTKQEVQETKQEVQEGKQVLTVLSAVQEETKQEVQETKQRISALEGKIDTMLALLQGSGRNQ
jgi:chromosome segregation ATPase